MSKFAIFHKESKRMALNLDHIIQINGVGQLKETNIVFSEGGIMISIFIKVSFEGVMKSLCDSGNSKTVVFSEIDEDEQLLGEASPDYSWGGSSIKGPEYKVL